MMNRVPARLRRVVPFVLAAMAIIIVWQAVVVITGADASLLPPPWDVAKSFASLAGSGVLFIDAGVSLARVISAWVLSAAVAVPLGLVMGRSHALERIIDPVIELFRPISPLAWIPLAILWFGIGEAGKVFVVIIGTFFPILLATVAGVKSIDQVLVHAGKVLGCDTSASLFRKVILPASLPSIVVGLRIAFGTGWASIIAAELVAARSGLGYLIANGMEILRADQVLVGMVVIGVLGVCFDAFFRYLNRRFAWGT